MLLKIWRMNPFVIQFQGTTTDETNPQNENKSKNRQRSRKKHHNRQKKAKPRVMIRHSKHRIVRTETVIR